jgi:ABC-2 type transport system permease protein
VGIGLFFSSFNVRFRDASNVVEIIRTIATWSVPILYTWSMVYRETENFRWVFHIYMSNPLAVAVELFHEAFWTMLPVVQAQVPAPDNITWPPGFGFYVLAAVGIIIFSLVLGQFVFRRFERSFAQDL